MNELLKNTIKVGERTWKFTGQYFADWLIYESGDDLALVDKQGKIENTLIDANKKNKKEEL